MIKLIRKTTTWALALLFAMYTVISPIHVNVHAAPANPGQASLIFEVPKFLDQYGGGVDYVTNNTWTLSKTANPTSLTLVHGTSGSVTYTVTATKVSNSVFSVTFHVHIEYPAQTYTGDVIFNLDAVISAPSGTPVFQTKPMETAYVLHSGDILDKNYTATFSLAGPISDYTPMKIAVTLTPTNASTPITTKSAAITFKNTPTSILNSTLQVSDDQYVANPSLAYDWVFSATGTQTYSKSFASGTVGVPYSVTNHVTGLGSDGGVATPAQATVTVNTIKATGDQLSITGYSGVYDSAAHSITVNNLISGDVVYYSLNNSAWTTTKPMFTNVTAPAIVYVRVENPNFNDRTGNSTVEITARPISITANSSSKVYDGSALTNNGYSLTAGTLASGESLTAVTVTGSRTNVGSSANVPSAAVIMDGAVNASGNYAITYVNGSLNVTAATGERLSITGYSNVYDSAAHSITVNNVVSGDVVYYSLTNNGSDWTTTKPMFTNVTAPAIVFVKVVNSNYVDRIGSGTVEITVRPISVTANSDSKVYNGSALTNSGYSLSAGTLAAGESFNGVTVIGSQTNVGSSDNIASAAVIMDGAVNTSANYNVTYVKGTLTVTPATGADLIVNGYYDIYDSAAHSISVANTISGDVVYYSLTDNGSDWSTTKPMFTDVTPLTTVYVKVMNPNYFDRTGDATVRIVVRPITVTANSDSKVFDGIALINHGYTLTSGTLAIGDAIDSVSVLGSQTNVGSSDNVASAAVILDGATNVSTNYSITYVKGTLTVTPATGERVSVTGYSDVYDAGAHSISITNLISGDTVYYSLTNNGTDWTLTKPTFMYVQAAVTVFVKVVNPNFVDRTGSGAVEIKVRPITVTADSNSKAYDGLALTDSGYTLSLGTLASGEFFDSVTVMGTQTVVGSSDNVASAAVILNGTNDRTWNYDITYVKGTLTVTKAIGAELELTGYSAAYDALAHGISVDNAITGDTVYYSLDGSTWSTTNPMFTNVTAVTTVYVKVTNDNFADRTGSETVEITARQITVTADSETKVYDGSALINSGYTLTLGTLAPGEFFDGLTIVGTQTNVGSSSNVASAAVILNGTTDVTANYDITYAPGTLSVTPATGEPLDITGYSGEYDGAAHSIIVNNLLTGGITPSFVNIPVNSDTVYYSLTNNGSDWTMTLPTFTNVTSTIVYVKVVNPNYVDRTGSGTVDITARPITITANSGTKTFNGLALTNNGYSLTLGSLAAGEAFEAVTVIGSQTAVGSSANVASAAMILNGTTDVSANYAITYVSGTLTVTAPANTAPTAANAIYTIQRGATITRFLFGNDVNGDPLTFQIVTQPTRGTLAVNGAGRFTYTNNGVSLTTDSFTYRVYDGKLFSGTRTITIRFTELPAENTAPVVTGATFDTPFNTPLNQDVAPLGSDADGDPLTFILVTQPAHGTVTLSPSGSFHYVPNATYSGADTFTFKANDGVADSNIGTVTINVAKEIIIEPTPTPQAQMPWWWLLALLPFLLFLIRRPRPEVQEVVMNPDGTVTTTWGYLGPRLMHKDYDRDESVLEVVSGNVKVVPPIEVIPYEFDRGRHENIFKTVSDKNAVIRWTIKKKAEELDKELIEKMLEKNKK
ncbi:MAG: Ig-like domain-containing protein [Erysipelotrichaceae bacterium]